MGLRTTERSENNVPRHPHESGGPSSDPNTMDSRFRWNDVMLERDSSLRSE
jgi:hypothetical protein